VTTSQKTGRWLRIGAVAVLLIAILLLWRSGLHEQLTRDRLRELAERAGAFGPVLFLLAYAAGEMLNLPSVVFVVVAGVVWPLYVALPTAFAGTLFAAAVVFAFARYVVSESARQAIHARMPPEMRRWDAQLDTHGVRTVAMIRLLTFLSPFMHWVLAASRVSFRDMMIGTALGVTPGVVLLVVMGDTAVEHWATARPYIFGGMGALLLFLLLRAWIRRRRLSASE
jgi:phospholipase D1/2